MPGMAVNLLILSTCSYARLTFSLLSPLCSIHNFGTAGHIEDISISKEHQGKGLGKLLINALSEVAKGVGCYKCILDCSPENEGFYQKCRYEKSGTEMSRYFEEDRGSYKRG